MSDPCKGDGTLAPGVTRDGNHPTCVDDASAPKPSSSWSLGLKALARHEDAHKSQYPFAFNGQEYTGKKVP